MFGNNWRFVSESETAQGFLSFAIFVVALALAQPAWSTESRGPGRLHDDVISAGPHRGAALARDGARLLIVGGEGPDGHAGTVHVFDALTGQTRVLTDELTPRAHPAVVVFDDQLFVLGGEAGTGALDTVESVSLVDGAVTAWPALPSPRTAGRAVMHQGLLVVGGGDHGWGPLAVSHVFDPARGEWYQAPAVEGRLLGWQVQGDKLLALTEGRGGEVVRRRLSIRQHAFVGDSAVRTGCERLVVPVGEALFCVGGDGTARALGKKLQPLGDYGVVHIGAVGAGVRLLAGVAFVDLDGQVRWLRKSAR